VRDDGEVILGGARCDWCGGGVRRSGVVGFFLGRGLAPHSKCGRGQHWRCGVGGVVGMQAVSVAWANEFSASGWRPGLVTVVIICQRSDRGSSWSASTMVWWSALVVAVVFLRPSPVCVL
jgi:hypothetical protein